MKASDLVWDRFFLVVCNRQTKILLDAWYDANIADLEWTRTLPPVFMAIGLAGGNPLHPSPGDPRQWNNPTVLGTYLYHGAPFGMLSYAAGPHRHQMTYDALGYVITSGVRAGRPQRYDYAATPGLHQTEDLEPFIRALQLDGNPCLGTSGDLDRPMIHEGANITGYLACRPPVINPEWQVKIDVTSAKAGESVNAPPFAGGQVWNFDVTKPGDSPNPDKHFVVFYKDVVDSGNWTVNDFSITLQASVVGALPIETILLLYPLNPRWTKLSGPDSGTLSSTTGIEVDFQNPKEGGVYRFAFDLDGYPRTEFCIVLPLAGAEMDGVVQANLIKADAFVAKMKVKYRPRQLRDEENLQNWFWNWNAGDYVGRPDSQNTPSVWCYAQVQTVNKLADNYGLGAACTWKGRPVLLSKLSNFIVGYTQQKLGISKFWAKAGAQKHGKKDGLWGTASESLGAGWDVANGSNYGTTVSALVNYIWTHEATDDKSRKVWPNPSPPDNDGGSSVYEGFDYDRQYAVPGFLLGIHF